MKFYKVLFLYILFVFPVSGQNSALAIQQTPEQEAKKQTEKLQQELNLTAAQFKVIYDINLRYARERQISNKRTEAVMRMKSKNAEIQNVLNPEQFDRLQSKRFERKTIETAVTNRDLPVNSSEGRTVTVPPQLNVRNSYRNTVAAPQKNTPQAIRHSATPSVSTSPTRTQLSPNQNRR